MQGKSFKESVPVKKTKKDNHFFVKKSHRVGVGRKENLNIVIPNEIPG